MKTYTVSQLAKMAGVSVRTLHHYDHIQLLKPASRSEAGYRLYGPAELLRLQQILFFKELDLPLDEIRQVLDDPGFDPIQALQNHRRLLNKRKTRLTRLLGTIDKTIHKLAAEDTKMKDEELYEGFTQEQIARYKREVRERYDPKLVAESERRVRDMSRAQWHELKAEDETVTRALAALMDKAPGHLAVQQLIARHHAMMEQFYPVSAEIYRGLGQLYVEHQEFRAYYEGYRPGLADFMAAAIAHYAEHTLAEEEKD
jgi:DNA-binding transcriptional MerR regulator